MEQFLGKSLMVTELWKDGKKIELKECTIQIDICNHDKYSVRGQCGNTFKTTDLLLQGNRLYYKENPFFRETDRNPCEDEDFIYDCLKETFNSCYFTIPSSKQVEFISDDGILLKCLIG